MTNRTTCRPPSEFHSQKVEKEEVFAKIRLNKNKKQDFYTENYDVWWLRLSLKPKENTK
jgi:hypothetical protein